MLEKPRMTAAVVAVVADWEYNLTERCLMLDGNELSLVIILHTLPGNIVQTGTLPHEFLDFCYVP